MLQGKIIAEEDKIGDADGTDKNLYSPECNNDYVIKSMKEMGYFCNEPFVVWESILYYENTFTLHTEKYV